MDKDLKVKGYKTENNGKKSKKADTNITDTFKESGSGSGSWQKFDTVLYRDYNSKPSSKVYGFDIDDTIITPKSGKKFAVDKNDWKILYDTIKETLQKHVNNGYKIVFFSNQGGIGKGRTLEGDWKSKIDKVQEYLNIPLQVFAGTMSDYYRKPSIGVWRLFVDNYNGGVKITDGTYIGDAAGRPKRGNKPKDFSDSDHKFSVNNDLMFFTPEAFFLGETLEKLPAFEFNPKAFSKNKILSKGDVSDLTKSQTEMVIFVGSAGSGKSTLYHSYFKGKDYGRVNQDTLKTEKKCCSAAEEFLSNNKSCVIDNTNNKKEKRAVFINVAKKCNAPVRCVFFDYPKDLVFHLNELRDSNPHRTHFSDSVSDVIIHTWYKYLEKPTENEGFKEVLTVNFVPGPFKNDLDEKCFYSYS